jgi:hypothetical protein
MQIEIYNSEDIVLYLLPNVFLYLAEEERSLYTISARYKCALEETANIVCINFPLPEREIHIIFGSSFR